MTDDEIKAAIEGAFEVEFDNYGGDRMLEGPLNGDEDAYHRALELLDGARIRVEWER